MSRKLDPQTVDRICELFFSYNLPVSVIARRLGVSQRAIFYYVRDARAEKGSKRADVLRNGDSEEA
jgi:transposase-like protein